MSGCDLHELENELGTSVLIELGMSFLGGNRKGLQELVSIRLRLCIEKVGYILTNRQYLKHAPSVNLTDSVVSLKNP